VNFYTVRIGYFSALSSSTNQLMPEITRTSPIEDRNLILSKVPIGINASKLDEVSQFYLFRGNCTCLADRNVTIPYLSENLCVHSKSSRKVPRPNSTQLVLIGLLFTKANGREIPTGKDFELGFAGERRLRNIPE
jgi:hypothetical protein